jgi:DNA end-binding protein Ku
MGGFMMSREKTRRAYVSNRLIRPPTMETALRELVQRKAKGHPIEIPELPERPSNVINLMDALRESVKGDSKGRRGAPRRGARKKVRRKSA